MKKPGGNPVYGWFPAPLLKEFRFSEAVCMKMTDLIMGYSCNNKCMHCTRGEKDRNLNIPYAEIIRIIDDAWERGTEKIILQGGEPTVRKDFFGIMEHVRKKGFGEVQLQSNGRMFSYSGFAKRASLLGIDEFCIPIHGQDGKTHDSFTGVGGSYDQTVRGIMNLVDLGQFVRVLVIITKDNSKGLGRIVENALRIGVRSFQLGIPIPVGNAKLRFKEIAPGLSDASECTLELLKAFGDRASFVSQDLPRCLLGEFGTISIEASGVKSEKIYPDIYFPDSERMRAEMKVLPEGCRQCRHFSACEGVYREYVERDGSDYLVPG